MNTSIFKAYDIRGIFPTEINEDVAATVGTACALMFPEGEVILAYDARHGSPELADALENSIRNEASAQGKKIMVRNVGLTTTPMFYFLVNNFNAVGGCMITASHNPPNYNGFKIVKAKAEMVPGTEMLDFIIKNKLA